jgi:hypothetical protein
MPIQEGDYNENAKTGLGRLIVGILCTVFLSVSLQVIWYVPGQQCSLSGHRGPTQSSGPGGGHWWRGGLTYRH